MLKVVLFLQNAWSPLYVGGVWPRRSWLKALRRSRSGQRLKVLEDSISVEASLWYDNTTPIVGDSPDSVIAPNFSHIEAVLEEQKPDVVVALGGQAARCLEKYRIPKLILPHPACRVLTNNLYALGGKLLSEGIKEVCELKQLRGSVRVIQSKKRKAG